MNYAIILAGGAGSRFWPLSSELEPKQFLNIGTQKPMLEETMQRISRLVNKDNMYIATSKLHKQKIKNSLKKFNKSFKNVLFEPEGKSTLAPIAVLSRKINRIDPEAVIAVLPCDHFVKDEKKFLAALRKGLDIARKGYIVTVGIPPQRPETGYGYIKIKSKIKKSLPAGRQENSKIYEVERFIEKPDLKRAENFLKDKRYYWNGGIFIFKPQVMLGEIKKLTPGVYKIIMQIKTKKDLNKFWPKLPFLSIDYGIMEKSKRAALVPADYGWVDLGSWQAIGEINKKDKAGNIFRGNYMDIGSRNTIIWSSGRLIATLGLRDIIIVDTKDALLVCAKDKTQEVKKIVRLLKRKN